MRILIATHAPLAREHGAAQIAMNLGAALRELGHDVTLWSPAPLPPSARSWNTLFLMRARLKAFIASQNPFDVIDAPSSLVSAHLCRDAFIVVRNVQPDLRYLAIDLWKLERLSFREIARFMYRLVQTTVHAGLVMSGWREAHLIVCLGELEFNWMKRWMPWWRRKLRWIAAAPSPDEQASLGAVRSKRAPIDATRALRLLWIGRWVEHKGRSELLRLSEAWFRARPGDSLTIAGCGAIAGELPRHLLDSGRITVLPAFSRLELPQLLAGHEVGLFTSKVEGWGLVLNEMLESGMRVYATEAGGTLDLRKVVGPWLAQLPEGGRIEMPNAGPGVDWSRYYETFSWKAIARAYVGFLGARMRPSA